MNKIFIEDINEDKDLVLKEDAIIVIKNSTSKIKYSFSKDIKVFILIVNSKIDMKQEISFDSTINIFSADSTVNVNLELLKDNINVKYVYSTINKNDNNYNIDINHFGNNITSTIINHGINTTCSKLDFVINTIVPRNMEMINTSQDSKIIVLKDNNVSIKPNLFIDNDDIEASHAAYIGRFKDEKVFYLMSRGITKEDSIDLLIKSFLIGSMVISDNEKELIFDIIKMYWR